MPGKKRIVDPKDLLDVRVGPFSQGKWRNSELAEKYSKR